MAIADYTLNPVQTTADAQVPNGTIVTPTTPPPVYTDPASIFQQTVPVDGPIAIDSKNQIELLKQALGIQTQSTQEQAQQFGTLGGNDAATKLADITAQYKAADLQNQGEQQAYLAQTRGIGGYTQNAQTGGMEDINRANAVKKLGLAADAALLQGRVDTAKVLSEQAIKAKYGDVQAKIDAIKNHLEINKDFLAREDKVSYEKQKFVLEAKQKEQEKKIKNETDISDMIITATPDAPQDIITNAKKLAASGASKLQVATALGKYGGDYLAREKIKAEIRKMDADAAKTRSEASGTGGTGGVGATSIAKDWVAQFNSGLLTADEIYTKIGSSKEAPALKNQVAAQIAAQGGKRVYGQDDATIQAIQSQIKNVDTLLYGQGKNEADKTTGGVGKIVGLVQGGAGILPNSLNTGKQDALAVAKNLVSNQTLQALADAKSKGITFGALSEGELGLVSGAASNISAKLIKDKDGNIIGFSGSEKQFKDDLKVIRTGLQNSIASKVATPKTKQESVADDILMANKNVNSQINNSFNLFDK